jgi:hypothetical protein
MYMEPCTRKGGGYALVSTTTIFALSSVYTHGYSPSPKIKKKIDFQFGIFFLLGDFQPLRSASLKFLNEEVVLAVLLVGKV